MASVVSSALPARRRLIRGVRPTDSIARVSHTMSSKPPELQSNPGLNASHITWYVTDRLRAGSINLYSAYLLMHEALRFERETYTQPAWKQRMRISQLLRIYYDVLTGRALGCTSEADEAAEWFIADAPLLQELRPHFLADRRGDGLALLSDGDFYKKLSDLRQRFNSLSDESGPFPPEVFPFDFAAPERELLESGSQAQFKRPQELDQETSDFYVQLQISR